MLQKHYVSLAYDNNLNKKFMRYFNALVDSIRKMRKPR